jgi:spore germination protein GerM
MRLSRVLFLLWLAGLLIVAGGCGGDSAAPSFEQASDTPRPTFRATVYFLTDDAAAPIGVRRTIARESPYARDALDALVEGPTAAERRRGISTAIPDQARVVSLTLRSRQRVLAVVNLTGLPPAQGRRGEEATLGMRVRVITQIARTLIGLSGIAGIEVKVDGKPGTSGRLTDGSFAPKLTTKGCADGRISAADVILRSASSV